jgi:hypothetical protein
MGLGHPVLLSELWRCRSLSAKEPLVIGLFCAKWPLCHTVLLSEVSSLLIQNVQWMYTMTIPWLYTMNKALIVCPICIGNSGPNEWLFGGKRSATWGILMSGSLAEWDLLFGGKRPNEWLFGRKRPSWVALWPKET